LFYVGNNEQEILLIDWCEEIIDSYAIEIKNDTKSFQNALAFCAIINYYRPDLMYEFILILLYYIIHFIFLFSDFKSLQSDRPISNFQIVNSTFFLFFNK
jgi:hypothetical protein